MHDRGNGEGAVVRYFLALLGFEVCPLCSVLNGHAQGCPYNPNR